MTQLNTTPSHHYTSVTSVVITVDIQFLSELFRKKQYTCNVVNKDDGKSTGSSNIRHNPNHSSLQLMCTLSRVLFWLCKTTQKYTDQSYALLQVLFPLSWCSTSRDCFRRPDLQLRKLENANGLRTCTKTVAIFRPTHAGCLVR